MKRLHLLSLLICMVFATHSLKAQCISTSQYPGTTVAINATTNATTTVTTCNFGGEYSVDSFTATGSYIVQSSIATDFVTITDNSNNVITFGVVPLTFNIPAVGLYRIHLSTNSSCGTDATCHTIEVVRPNQAPCSTMPASTVIVNTPTICPGNNGNFSINTAYTGSGITYQWYTAPTSTGPFSAVATGTNATYSGSFSTSTYLMATITCSSGPTTVSATPSQIIVSAGNPCECNSYCASAATNTFDDEIFNVTIGSLNNTSSCTTTATGPGSALNLYSNYAGTIPAPNLAAGINYTMSVTVGQCNTGVYSGIVTTYIDFNQNGLFTDPGELVYTSPYSAFQIAGTTFTTNVTIPVNALSGITRMRVIAVESSVPQPPCGTYSYGETEDYCVNIVPPTPCSGAPGANSALTNLSTVCSGGTATLSLANSYTVGGLAYQWSAATTSVGPYSAVSGATLSSFSATNITSTTWYQAVITCTNGPSSTTSTPVEVAVVNNPCQCAAYCASQASFGLYDEIFNVSIGTLNNTSNCNQTGVPGSTLNLYSNYSGMVAPPTITAGSVYPFSVTVGQCGTFNNNGGVIVYMDFNQNGSFTDPGEQVYASAMTTFSIAGTTLTANITIPATALTGITRMRVIAAQSIINQASCGSYNYGETEDYCVDIMPAPPCSGAPAANSAVASMSAVCPNGSSSLSLSTTYTIGGLTYQWSAATSSAGPYSAVSGATLSTFSPSNITASTWYQAVITCTNGNVSTTATAVQVLINNSPCECVAYCTSSATSTFDDEIFNVTIGTLNNSSTCSQTGGPGSVLNMYSNYTGIVAAPTLTVNNTYTFSVIVGQCNASAYSGIVQTFIDYNQNGLFTDPGELVYTSPYSTFSVTGTTFTTNVSIPTSALPGVTRMRVKAVETSVAPGPCGTFSWGEVEDYCVVIDPGPPCTAANGGIISPATYSTCSTQTIALTSNSVTIGSGMVYQWMVSTTQGGPYSPVTSGTGSNTPSYITGTLSPNTFYYVLEATCTTASLTGLSNEATVIVNATPTVMAASNSPICAGQQVNLTSTTNIGTGFMWAGPNSYTSNVQNPTILNASASAQGTYTLIVSTANCSATPVTAFVTVNSTNLSIVAAPPSLCLGNSATLTAVGNPTTLTWSTGATTSSIVVSPSTNTVYTATGTGTSNCAASSSIALTVTNPTISTTGASVCAVGSTGTLTANAFGPVSWYATSTPSNPLGTGNTFTANAATTTTFYAQAVNTATNSLFTTLIAGNGAGGNMFDVTALNSIDVNGFDMHFSSTGTGTMQVWYRTGSFVGFESSNAGWTMVYTTTVTALGTGVLTPVPGTFTVNVPAGQTYGFYVTAVTGGPQVNYTNGTSLGAVYVQNADAQIKQGKGGGYFSVINSPRIFNGQMRYSATGCTSPIVPVVFTVGSSASITASATSGTVCAGGSTALNANGASTYTWSTGATGNVIAVTPSVTTTYSVNGDNGAGCVGTGTVEVFVNQLPTVSLTAASTTACTNGPTISLTGSPTGGVYTGSNVSSGVFTPGATAGTFIPGYNITSTVTGCSNTATLTMVVSVCTDIQSKTASLKGLSVYPNPNLGEFTVELANGLNKTIELTDLTGRIIFTESSEKDMFKVNIEHLANGVYFVKIQSDKNVEIIKLIKQ